MLISPRKFIGRKQEIEFLTSWLADVAAPSVVYVHDALERKESRGGIGKTWLLREFYELIDQQYKNVIPVQVDFFNVLDRNSVVIAERVVRAVRERYPSWTTENFDRLLQEYHGVARGQKTEATIWRERLADALAADLHLLQQQMIETSTYLLLFFDTYELIEYNPITAV